MIYYFEDTRIEASKDLQSALSKYEPGDKVKLTIIRNNKTIDIEVELVEPEA